MGCSPPSSFVHGISLTRILEWVAISFSRGSSQPRDRTRVSHIVDRHFTVWATREVYDALNPNKWTSVKMIISIYKFYFVRHRETKWPTKVIQPLSSRKAIWFQILSLFILKWLNLFCVHNKLLQLCLTLCDLMDCSLPGSSVHGILQARILEWIVMPSSRATSWPRNRTSISCIGAGTQPALWSNSHTHIWLLEKP